MTWDVYKIAIKRMKHLCMAACNSIIAAVKVFQGIQNKAGQGSR